MFFKFKGDRIDLEKLCSSYMKNKCFLFFVVIHGFDHIGILSCLRSRQTLDIGIYLDIQAVVCHVMED